MSDGFYDTPDLRQALAEYDFAAVFRAVRTAAGLSQEELGFYVGLPQAHVSAVELGKRRLRDIGLIARITTGLGIPPRLLGFPGSAGTVEDDAEVSWVDRRDFLALVTAATAGSTMFPELHRLGDLLPAQAEAASQPRIGHADVDAIEAVTSGLRNSNIARGGGLCRSAAIAHLQQSRALQNASCSEAVRARLALATADTAMMAGYASFDAEHHDAARRLLTYAVETANHVEEHPRSTDVTVSALLDMAEQSLYLQRPKEALSLTKLASATAARSRHPVTEATQSIVSTYLAECWAALGEVEPCQRALGQSAEEFARADVNKRPQWTQWISASELSVLHGITRFELSRVHRPSSEIAVEQLCGAMDDENNPELSRAFTMTTLAASHFGAGDIDSAVSAGNKAIDAVGSLSSARARSRLRRISTASEPFARRSDVADLRDRIRTTLHTA